MIRITAIVVVLAALAGGLLWLSGGISDRAGQAARRAEFRFASATDHHHLDPQRMSWLHDIRVAECLFEPLVKRDMSDLSITAGVAERWEISDDGLTYTFHLRPEARWSNGDPVTSADFLYAWRRALMPDLGADYAHMLFPIDGAEAFFNWRARQLAEYAAGAERSPQAAEALWQTAAEHFNANVGLSAPDERTLVVRLARRVPYFIELCAFATFMPLHPASVERETEFQVETGMRREVNWTRPGRLISNGPYVLEEYRTKSYLFMTANPHYWDRANIGSQSIIERIIDDHQTALLEYNRGGLDWLPDIPTALPIAADLVSQNRSDVHVRPAAGTYFYNFNCLPTRPDGSPNPLADPRVRRALSMAIDRQTIVSQVTRLNQPVARTFVPLGALDDYHPPVEAGVNFDPDAARQLLAEAGYPEGRGLTGLSILINPNQGHEYIAQRIQTNWQQHLGVSVRLESVQTQVFGERLKSQNYMIARARWYGDYRDATTFLDKFRTDNGNNDAAWSHSEFDALMRQADDEADPVRRAALMREAEALMLAEQPVAPIFQEVSMYLYDAGRITGLTPNPWKLRRLDVVRVQR
jgi:oligopeptide transport system substrate-binding protein